MTRLYPALEWSNDGPIVAKDEFGERLTCYGCKHLSIYDWHYLYCGAQPDSSPSLRPGAGKQIRWANPKEVGCPRL